MNIKTEYKNKDWMNEQIKEMETGDKRSERSGGV